MKKTLKAEKETVQIPKELLINLYYDWRDKNYDEMGEWFAQIREILFDGGEVEEHEVVDFDAINAVLMVQDAYGEDTQFQEYLGEQVIASCDNEQEDKAW